MLGSGIDFEVTHAILAREVQGKPETILPRISRISAIAVMFVLAAMAVVAPIQAVPTSERATSTRVDTYPRQPGIDAIHYTFGITLSDETDRISVESVADLRFVLDGVTSLFLDLTSVSRTSDGKGMVVRSVTMGGAEVSFVHEDDRLTLTLAEAPARGERRRFTVHYSGIAGGGLWIGPNRHGERTFFSTNWPDKARQWLPVIDHPSDKTTSEFMVVAPDHYQVVANGLLVEEDDLGDGNRRTHWKQSVPISTWLNALGVARFVSRTFAYVDGGIALQTWVNHQERAEGIATFEVPVMEAYDFYTSHIGPYSYEKLANVEAAGMGGGMEHASAIFYGERSVSMEPATGLVAHEIAHQWWGNSVTESDWNDVWLSEGFATYFTLLTTEHYRGRDAFVAGLQRNRASIFDAEQRRPDAAVIHPNLDDMGGIFNGLQYQKGGWVLHVLRGQVGTDAFWEGIRTYYSLYQNSIASTDDLQRVMEEVSGQELGWFFDQWLRRAGSSPMIEGMWHHDARANRVVIELSQTQGGDAYRVGLDIGIRGEDGTVRVERVEMTETSQSFEIAVEGSVLDVVLDPETWLLAGLSLERK
jgi:aminopeptidase N